MTKARDKNKEAPERKRGKRGAGRLYKRDSAGKEYSADDKMKGAFWLAYSVNGKRIRQRLLDDDGNSIKSIGAAKKARARILAPLAAADKVEQLRNIQSKLNYAEEDQAQAIDEANPPLTIARAWDAFLTSKDGSDISADMQCRYFGYWKNFNKWLSANRPELKCLREITPQTAQDYAANLNRAKISPHTYNKHVDFLRRFLRTLAEPARMPTNPFEKDGKSRFRKKKIKKSNARRELTIAELKEVLEKATGDLKTLFYIGTFTGLRLGDCCTLKWSEVDLDRGLVRRVPNKTAADERPVLIGIPSALHAELAETPSTRRKGYVLPKYAALYTYRSPLGNPDKQPEITREIQSHFKDCEIQTIKEGTGPGTGKRAVVEVGFHSLRHTFVSLHSERGTPQAVVQSIVGHGSPAMTAHYTHIGEDTALRVAGVLELTEEEPSRKPLPEWARELIKGLTAENLKTQKKKLLKG